jgi:hypothetical protein
MVSLLLDAVTVTANVKHVGAGKYLITDDRSGVSHKGKIIDGVLIWGFYVLMNYSEREDSFPFNYKFLIFV